jgi:hypothetical protein
LGVKVGGGPGRLLTFVHKLTAIMGMWSVFHLRSAMSYPILLGTGGRMSLDPYVGREVNLYRRQVASLASREHVKLPKRNINISLPNRSFSMHWCGTVRGIKGKGRKEGEGRREKL